MGSAIVEARPSVRGELEAVGFVPSVSKLYPPARGLVSRSALVERVLSRRPDVVVVTAPAGYGKSTFLSELAAHDPRPTAVVSLTAAENDPAALLSYLALALDESEPVDPWLIAPLWARRATIGSPAVQRFVAALGARQHPVTIALDDVHELVDRDVLDLLPMLVAELPRGSSIVLAGRTAMPLPLGRLRVKRRLVEVGVADLGFDTSSAELLFRELGIEAAPADTARLVERTEGWPVALYLAALAYGDRTGTMATHLDEFAATDRYLVQYFGDELLGRVEADVAEFLMEASCLERVSGHFCDEVLQRHGSTQLLEQLERNNLLVIPLDDRRQWYRFHTLMTDFLQTELARRDPVRRASIHRRASEWFDAQGDGDAAVSHAVRGGDLDRAEAMVGRWLGTVSTAGRLYPNTARWVSMFPEEQLDGRPALMVVAALSSFAHGQAGRSLQWLERAAAALPDRRPDDAHGVDAAVWLAVARAIVAPLSPEEMASEARYAYEHVGRGVGHPVSCLAAGAAAFMLGDETEALRLLHEGADSALERPTIIASCLAHIAAIDVGHGLWTEAIAALDRARKMVGDAVEIPSLLLVTAVNVVVEIHAGRRANVDADRQRCREQLTGFVDVAPWLNLQVRVALARAALLCGDLAEARALVDEATAILADLPDGVGVAEQLASLRHSMSTSPKRSQGFGPSSLTTAELRVLQLLPTHLSIGEIADRLYVSRNTVKSQAVSIYRKLGTTSRSGAVDLAIAAGLLHGPGAA